MGPEGGPSATDRLTSASAWAVNEGDRGLDRVVQGRARELRTIGAFAAGLDPAALVVSGLSGIGKSLTVLAALHRIGAAASTVRVVRSCRARPYAEGLDRRRRLDLTRWAAVPGPEPGEHLDPVRLMSAVTSEFVDLGPGPRVLFVDDVDLLSPSRAAWLQHLADVAYEQDWRVIAAVRLVTDTALADDIEVLDLGPLDEPSMRRCLEADLRQPVAADVAERLHRWSAGNPRVALELADALGSGQLLGSAGWAGPQTVGPAARRTYRPLLAGLAPAQVSDLARQAVQLRRGGPVPAAVPHPLLALLCEEQVADASGLPLPAVGEPRDLEPRDLEPHDLETVLEGLHLDDLSAAPSARHTRRATARATGVALLTGSTWTGEGARLPTDADPAWTDHLWWRDTAPVADAARAAGARVAAELLTLEDAGHVRDAGRLRTDLSMLGTTPGQHWVGVHLQVRGCLLLGDVVGARRVLEATGPAAGRTAAEVVARDLARAMVAMVEGRATDVHTHLADATRLRPGVADWLPTQGLLLAADAMLDGLAPAIDAPPRSGSPSTRALGEFAADLGVAHLAVGRVGRAAELFTIALERCSWPYRGRAHARADLVEAVVVAGTAGQDVPARVRRLLDPPVAPTELADTDAAAADARMNTLLAGCAGLTTGFDGWLPRAQRPVSLWQRLRSLVACVRHGLVHGCDDSAELLLREARTLAPLAGVPGWRVTVEADLWAGTAPARTAWERLGENEREIVQLVLFGATNAQIAAAAYLSVRSVANRLRSIYAVLGLRDRRDLVERARVDPPGWLTSSA